MNRQKELIFKGKTAVFIDWANVYGWRKSLRREIYQIHKGLYKRAINSMGDLFL